MTDHRPQRRLRRFGGVTAALVALALLAPATAAGADQPDPDRYDHRRDLAELREATAAYHDRNTAVADGYQEFLDCFESDEGGMGQHYVNLDLLDGEVDRLRPEAMVYEVDGSRHRLVAVEWIVPGAADDTPPRLFERDFHYNTALGVWVLHAWIWKPNPLGVFTDYNPRVGRCG